MDRGADVSPSTHLGDRLGIQGQPLSPNPSSIPLTFPSSWGRVEFEKYPPLSPKSGRGNSSPSIHQEEGRREVISIPQEEGKVWGKEEGLGDRGSPSIPTLSPKRVEGEKSTPLSPKSGRGTISPCSPQRRDEGKFPPLSRKRRLMCEKSPPLSPQMGGWREVPSSNPQKGDGEKSPLYPPKSGRGKSFPSILQEEGGIEVEGEKSPLLSPKRGRKRISPIYPPRGG